MQSEKCLQKHDQSKQKHPYIIPEKCQIKPQKVFEHFHTLHPQSAVFSVIPGFSWAPRQLRDSSCSRSPDEASGSRAQSLEPNLPSMLTDLYDPKYTSLAGTELVSYISATFEDLKVTQEEAMFLEGSTRTQSLSQTWHDYRKGHITSSRFHDVLHYSFKAYPLSIIRSIMQYNSVSINVPALKWGREHEDSARMEYVALMKEKHVNFSVRPAGLFINPLHPWS